MPLFFQSLCALQGMLSQILKNTLFSRDEMKRRAGGGCGCCKPPSALFAPPQQQQQQASGQGASEPVPMAEDD